MKLLESKISIKVIKINNGFYSLTKEGCIINTYCCILSLMSAIHQKKPPISEAF